MRTSCYYDYLNMERFVQKLAAAAHLSLDMHTYYDNDFNIANIDSLAAVEGRFYDIFFIYFSTPGKRIKDDSSKFPAVYVPGNNAYYNVPSLVKKIKNKLMVMSA